MFSGLLYCTVIAGCVIAVPFSYGAGLWKLENTQNPSPLIKKIGDFTLSKSSKGGSLSIKNLDGVLEKIQTRGETVDIKEVGMKFGDQMLSINDLLVSPEQDGRYYLAKPTDKNNGYRLSNGHISRTFHRNELDWKKLEHVHLDWEQWNKVGKMTLSTIAVGSCQFTRLSESSLFIRCRQFFDGKKADGETVQGVLNFSQ